MRHLRDFFRRTKRLPSQAAYKLWADSYPPFAHNALMEIEQATMLRLLPDLAGLQVLDLACGSGRYCLIAQSHGAQRVLGVDNSSAMLAAARRAGITCELIQAPMWALPMSSQTIDVILCGLAIGHLPAIAMQQAFAEMSRILRPNGVGLFSDFHPALYAHGGRRTFTASNGQSYEVEHYPHTVDDYVRAVERVGLSVDAIEEPIASNIGVPAVLTMRCKVRATED